ncbi:hypothetical protein SAMN05421857_3957 [Chryseobacterium formosense]|nr:hypothetical protein SAMN05421857_3957 [Chryseobacterium formosense]
MFHVLKKKLFSPMKKNDSLKMKSLKPKKQTIDFLLSFSKNLEVVKIKNNHIHLSKN